MAARAFLAAIAVFLALTIGGAAWLLGVQLDPAMRAGLAVGAAGLSATPWVAFSTAAGSQPQVNGRRCPRCGQRQQASLGMSYCLKCGERTDAE